MPGMIDTHRHMWQTAMRGVRRRLDADPVLRLVLPRARQDVPPRGHPRRQPALRPGSRSRPASPRPSTGRTACRRVDHAEAAVDALQAVPGRFVLAYGNIQAGPWEWTADPAVRDFFERRRTGAGDMLGFQLAFDVTGDPAFPEKAAFEVARELGLPVTTHAGVWGATNDDGIRLMHENGFMTPETRLRPRGDAERRLLPADRGHRRLGLGVDRVRAERRPGLPADLAGAAVRHPGVAVDGHQRVVERRPVLGDAHDARRRPLARAPRGARQGRHRHRTARCAPSRSSTGRPAAAPARSAATTSAGSSPASKADVVLIKNDRLAGVVPAAEPLRPRGVPGPARRRAHRARRRPGRQARAAGWSASTWPPYAARSRRPSSTCRPAHGRGGWHAGHAPRAARGRARCSTTPTSTPTTSPTAPTAPAAPCSASPGSGAEAERRRWQDAARDRTSSSRWRAGSTCCACFDAAPPRDDAQPRSRRRPAWPGRPPGGCC